MVIFIDMTSGSSLASFSRVKNGDMLSNGKLSSLSEREIWRIMLSPVRICALRQGLNSG